MKIWRIAVCIVLVIEFFTSKTALAQEYSKVRLGAGAGFGLASGTQGKGGPVIYLEPAFRISDKLLVGIRLEGASIRRGLSRSIAIDNPITIHSSSSVFMQYYFGKKYLRTFIGAGAGYVIKSNEVLVVDFAGSVNTFQIGTNDLGLILRAGVEWGHFMACIDYNFMGDEKVSPFLELKNSYPAIKLGFLLGGGIH